MLTNHRLAAGLLGKILGFGRASLQMGNFAPRFEAEHSYHLGIQPETIPAFARCRSAVPLPF